MEIVNRPLARKNSGFVVRSGPEAGSTVVRKDRDSGEWKPVERFEREVGDLELSNSYGLWKDKEIKQGFIFRETVRKKDGQVQSDEVKSFRDAKDHARMSDYEDGDPTYTTRTGFQVKLDQTPQGTLVMLEEQWNPYPR
jgi:hypothetical protein